MVGEIQREGAGKMSVEIPENMEDVAMKIARAGVHGKHLDEDQVINQAVLDIMQAFMDEALEGHYDDVAWKGDNLLVTDIMGKEVGIVKPTNETFVADFKQNADELVERLEDEAGRIVGGR